MTSILDSAPAESVSLRRPVRSVTDITIRTTQLLKRESPALLDYLAWRTDNIDDAADLLGDLMVVAWRRSASIPTDDMQARMWFFGVARNLLASHRRTTARRARLHRRIEESVLPTPTTASLSGLADHGSEDSRDRVREQVSRLDPTDQEIISLYHWSGFSLKEIASLLSLRESTVRSRYHRAKASLREALIASDDLAS